MGMRLLRGRMLDAHDTEKAPKVLVVSETMVKQLWPGADAIDQCVRVTGSADQSAEGVRRSLQP